MAINISETLFERILSYLQAQANSDRTAQDLLALMQGYATIPEKEFGQRLFGVWKELADLHVGENCWSYPVEFADLAEALSLSVEKFVQYLNHVKIDAMQLLAGRGQNYMVDGHQVGALTFHGELVKSVKATKPKTVIFKVGDRVRVNANRPQYANHVGTVDQVISVSCRVKLDNGWTAFLPNQCLDLV
jgi:hypothetical protein